jgi:hypothetical protein
VRSHQRPVHKDMSLTDMLRRAKAMQLFLDRSKRELLKAPRPLGRAARRRWRRLRRRARGRGSDADDDDDDDDDKDDDDDDDDVDDDDDDDDGSSSSSSGNSCGAEDDVDERGGDGDGVGPDPARAARRESVQRIARLQQELARFSTAYALRRGVTTRSGV